MPEDPVQEKTEQATPKKKGEARQKGNVARSTDLNSSLVLLTGIIAIHFAGAAIFSNIQTFANFAFVNMHSLNLTHENVNNLFPFVLGFIVRSVGPVALAIMAVGLASNYMQIGVLFTLEHMKPKGGKINPLSGIKKVVSKQSLVELVKGLLKISIVAIVAYTALSSDMKDTISLMDMNAGQILTFILKSSFKIAIRCAVALLILAIFDYAYTKWQYDKQLMMTKQELKEERKQYEGNPEIKARVRSIQREMAQKRMMEQIPDSDLVITNPTHIAVALKYAQETMAAPTVIAKGQRLIAQKIKDIADEHGIPIVEDKPLARALYDSTEVGMQIPEDLYRAVAGVLAYIYRLKGVVV